MITDVISIACILSLAYIALKAVDFKDNVIYVVQPIFAVLGAVTDWLTNLLKKMMNFIFRFFNNKRYALLPVQQKQFLLEVHDEIAAAVVE